MLKLKNVGGRRIFPARGSAFLKSKKGGLSEGREVGMHS